MGLRLARPAGLELWPELGNIPCMTIHDPLITCDMTFDSLEKGQVPV